MLQREQNGGGSSDSGSSTDVAVDTRAPQDDDEEEPMVIVNQEDAFKTLGWDSKPESCQILQTKGYVMRVCEGLQEYRRTDVSYTHDSGMTTFSGSFSE